MLVRAYERSENIWSCNVVELSMCSGRVVDEARSQKQGKRKLCTVWQGYNHGSVRATSKAIDSSVLDVHPHAILAVRRPRLLRGLVLSFHVAIRIELSSTAMSGAII